MEHTDHVCDAAEAMALGLIDKVVEPGQLVPVPAPAVEDAAAHASWRREQEPGAAKKG